jgi:hypothetical protein
VQGKSRRLYPREGYAGNVIEVQRNMVGLVTRCMKLKEEHEIDIYVPKWNQFRRWGISTVSRWKSITKAINRDLTL